MLEGEVLDIRVIVYIIGNGVLKERTDDFRWKGEDTDIDHNGFYDQLSISVDPSAMGSIRLL